VAVLQRLRLIRNRPACVSLLKLLEADMRKLTALALLFLASCGRPDLADDKLSSRELNLEEFFQGRTVAHGQFQDRFGTVRRRFRVDIAGDWDGERLKLVEDFTLEDSTLGLRPKGYPDHLQ
jgi:hypothetical protein